MSSFLLVYSPNLSGLTSIRLGTNVFNNKLIHAQDELKKLDLWEHGNLFVNNSLYHFSPAQASVINLLADYARQHGNYAQTLPAKTQKYVRGIYSCPHQAGNRLTHFLNAFAFAVVTNRTLLWEYCSDSHHFCPMHGSIRDCEKVLHRAPWIQSYEEIIGASDKPLGNDIEPSPYNALSGTNSLLDQIKERREVLFDQQPEKVLDFGVLEFQTAALAEANQSLSAGALSVANQLFAAGMSFAYGALFHMVFRFHQRVMPSQIYMTKHIQFVKSGGLTVAIHSRHTDQVDDGSRIEGERQCIAQVISSRGNCSINIMSDRSETIKRLVNFSTIEYGCDSIVAEHQMGSSLLQEHGAYAGVGLFQGLLCSVRHEMSFQTHHH